MSAFSEESFDSKHYASFRPLYPRVWYEYLAKFHVGGEELLVDVGCGPGTATFALAKQFCHFKSIIGTDISPRMIEHARELEEKHRTGRTTFEVSPAEDFGFLKDRKIDLLTVAEAVHWFDWPKFQNAAAEALNVNGTIAIWGYSEILILQYPEVDDLLHNFKYSSDGLGPYWQYPGIGIISNMLKGIELDPALFSDIEVREYWVRRDNKRSINGSYTSNSPIYFKTECTVQAFGDYVRTWSSYHKWKREHSSPSDEDIVTRLLRDIMAKTGLGLDSKITLDGNFIYMLGRKRSI